MSNSLIITIGREYGSGGRQIGEIVAKTLGINFYDKNLITLAAQKSGLSDEFIANNEQRVRSGWMQNLAASAAYSNGFFSGEAYIGYRGGKSVWFRHYGFTWEETGIMPPDRWAPMPK